MRARGQALAVGRVGRRQPRKGLRPIQPMDGLSGLWWLFSLRWVRKWMEIVIKKYMLRGEGVLQRLCGKEEILEQWTQFRERLYFLRWEDSWISPPGIGIACVIQFTCFFRLDPPPRFSERNTWTLGCRWPEEKSIWVLVSSKCLLFSSAKWLVFLWSVPGSILSGCSG